MSVADNKLWVYRITFHPISAFRIFDAEKEKRKF